MDLNAETDYTAIEPRSTDLTRFELLYNDMSGPLLKYADYYVNDLEAANGIVNDLFVQLWFKNWQPENIKGYLYRAVKNASLNYLEQHKRSPLSYLGTEELALISDLQEVRQDPGVEPDRLKYLENVISLLPKKRQLVFRMYRLEGFSYAEIAALLQISVRTVEDHLSKSMQFIHAQSKPIFHTNLTEA